MKRFFSIKKSLIYTFGLLAIALSLFTHPADAQKRSKKEKDDYHDPLPKVKLPDELIRQVRASIEQQEKILALGLLSGEEYRMKKQYVDIIKIRLKEENLTEKEAEVAIEAMAIWIKILDDVLGFRAEQEELAEEEEEMVLCDAPLPKDPGIAEGQFESTQGPPIGSIKGERNPCNKAWYYYMGPIGSYQPVIDGEVAQAGWYDRDDYFDLIDDYVVELIYLSGDVNSALLNKYRLDQAMQQLTAFESDREFSEDLNSFLANNYNDFLDKAENRLGSGKLEVVYPFFNVLDIMSGMSITSLKAFTRMVTKATWKKAGMKIRQFGPGLAVRSGDDLVELSNGQGEVLFRIADDALEINGSSYVDEGAEILERQALPDDVPVRSASGEDLTGQVDLVKTADGKVGVAAKGGAARAAQYSSEWVNSSLKEVIGKFAYGRKGIKTTTGKTIYKNEITGIQVVYDDAGNYFRIENTNLTGKRRYLDLEGNIPNNKVVDGKVSGRSQAEYNQVTHFNNID